MLGLMVRPDLGSEMFLPRSSFSMFLIRSRCPNSLLSLEGVGGIHTELDGMSSSLRSLSMFLIRHRCFMSFPSLAGVRGIHDEPDGMCLLFSSPAMFPIRHS